MIKHLSNRTRRRDEGVDPENLVSKENWKKFKKMGWQQAAKAIYFKSSLNAEALKKGNVPW